MAVGVITLGSIKQQARERCDRVNSTFFTEDEMNNYATHGYKALYDILVQKFGDDYFVGDPFLITADGINDTFDLPEDFYKLAGVDMSVNLSDPSAWYTLKPFMMAERNRFVLKTVPTAIGRISTRYKIRGNKLWFSPIPNAGQVFRVFDSIRPVELTDDADLIDGVSGWELYIILDMCVAMMAKEESDVTPFIAQQAQIIKRIEEAAENRDAGSPQRVSDVLTGYDLYGGGGFYDGFDGL